MKLDACTKLRPSELNTLFLLHSNTVASISGAKQCSVLLVTNLVEVYRIFLGIEF